MNTKKARQVRICECGAQFLTSVKFGNETKCDACYDAHSVEFERWLRSLPDDQLSEVFASIKASAAALGVTVQDTSEEIASQEIAEPTNPEEIAHDNQLAIDAAFASLMEGIDL